MTRTVGALDRIEAELPQRVTAPTPTDPYRVIGDILEAARSFLGADAIYAGEFHGDRQVFHWIAGDAASFGLRPGASIPRSEAICHDGTTASTSSLVNDTGRDRPAGALDITARAGIGAYLVMPIVLPEGSVYGTLCAINHGPTPQRGVREERFLHVMSRLLADQIVRIASDGSFHTMRIDRIRASLRATESIRIALQPIVSLRTRVVVGEEALTRFPDERSPIEWLREAWNAGVGPQLEFTSMRTALEALPALPKDVYLSLNASPSCVMLPELDEILRDVDLRRIVLEITEHDPIEDYRELRKRVAALRRRGLRLAIDDACAGFASLAHVLQLGPDIIKLDVSLIRGIEHDNARQALASGLVAFATRIGASIVAEGVENEKQVDVLNVLGIAFGQGFLLGGPGNGIGRHVPTLDFHASPLKGLGDPHNNHTR